MNGIKSLVLSVSLGVLMFSCNNDPSKPIQETDEKAEKTSENANMSFFYPRSAKPLVYVYSVANNPFLETYLKITSVTSKSDTLMMLEYFDGNLELKEGYTINLNKGFLVTNHMTSSQGIKYTSRIAKNNYFPTQNGNVASFVIDFPTQNDTVVGLYERDMELVDTIAYNFQDSTVECVKALEHIRLTRLHTITKKENEQLGEMVSLYAKGIGKVAQFSSAGGDTMKLVRTITIEEWNKLAPQL
jgi:hypothetical protein